MMRVEADPVLYHQHFRVNAALDPFGKGLYIDVNFENISLREATPNIEIWFPIEGYLEYRYITGEEQLIVIVDRIYDIKTSEKPEDYLIKPGHSVGALFYCRIPLEHSERMKEVADKNGTVIVFLHLCFSALYRAGSVIPKTYTYHPVLRFEISKVTLEQWIAQWVKPYILYEDLPQTVPDEVFSDYMEAVKALNVGAYRCSVAMARRALQQALEDKGATQGKKLLDQIDYLESKGLLDKATATLAHGVRQFGNYGAHPQTDLLAQITPDDARLVINVLRRILKVLYGSP